MRSVLTTGLLISTVMSFVPAWSQDAARYELPGRLNASDTLPGVSLKTGLYEVSAEVDNDGFMNHYRIYSTYHGPYLVRGDERARERIHEINVMDQLANVQKSDSYKKGLEAAGQSTLNSVKTIVTNPVETISAVPAGVKRFFGNVSRSTKQERKSEYEDSAAEGILGQSKAKRQIAFEFSVDPYSSNEALQQALSDVAWASFAGGMSLTVVRALVVPPVISTPLALSQASVEMGQLVRDESPESLQKINSDKLKAIGASDAAIEAFLTNRWYSPLRETAIATALYNMGRTKNAAAYLPRATEAASEEEAFFMQRSVQLLSAYHQNRVSLSELHMPANVPIGETPEGKLATAFAIDHLLWTEDLHSTITNIRADLPQRLANQTIELWLGGTASATAKAELAKAGIQVHEHAYEALLKSASGS